MDDEIELSIALLLEAHADGTIDDEELLLLVSALDMEQRNEPVNYGPRLDLDSLTDKKCLEIFRFRKEEIRELCILFRLQNNFVFVNGTTWTAEEGLCVVLRRLSYPNRLVDLEGVFGRCATSLSIIFNTTCIFIVNTWRHHLENFHQAPYFTNQLLASYCAAVGRLCPLQHCFGFIDGTVRPICRPGQDQRSFYNGHKRLHALKYQAIATPDGLIAHLSAPLEGRRHDSAMLAESRLLDVLQTLPLANNGHMYCVYGDAGYPLRPQLIVPFAGNLTVQQEQFNTNMSTGRIAVEWAFGKVSTYFAFVGYRRNQKLLLQPVAAHYFCAVLLTNCHTCLYGNEGATHFSIDPPSLYEYLS